MSDDYTAPTPGSKTMPAVQQQNDQGQGSAYHNSSKMFEPKVRLEEWPPDRSGRAPGDAS